MSWIERFGIGFLSSTALPGIRLAQVGIEPMAVVDFVYIIGTIIPFVLMGGIIGLYAVLIEKEETDVKRLFRTCIAMPGVFMTLAHGQGQQGTAQADIGQEIVCEKKQPMVQGLMDTIDSLVGNRKARYLVLSITKGTHVDFIKRDDKKYWVVASTHDKPKSGLYYDLSNCSINGTLNIENIGNR